MLEITERNPARALKGFLPKRETAHMPALPREELAEFYRRLLAADIKQQNRIAVLLIMLVFVRNTELRVRPGNVVIAMASSGLHSNGYSLARHVLLEKAKLPFDSYMEELGRTLGEELLERRICRLDIRISCLQRWRVA